MLIIKFIFQVYSLEVFVSLKMNDIYFVFGILAMIIGSLLALKEVRIKKMLAYSSVAQIGYIFMGIGLGSEVGVAAALCNSGANKLGIEKEFVSCRVKVLVV